MNQVSFEQCVQECLDLSQDPLDNADVLAFVEQHPEALDALVDLRAVGLNPTWPAPTKRNRWLSWKLTSLAAAAILVLSFIIQSPSDFEQPKTVKSTSPMPLAKAPTSKFLSLQVTRSTSSSSNEVLHHKTSPSARVLSVSSQTRHNIQ